MSVIPVANVHAVAITSATANATPNAASCPTSSPSVSRASSKRSAPPAYARARNLRARVRSKKQLLPPRASKVSPVTNKTWQECLVFLTSQSKTEGWPSGRRRTLGKRVCGQPYRGFESLPFRHDKFSATGWRFCCGRGLVSTLCLHGFDLRG